MEVKQSTSFRAPVRLTTYQGAPVLGAAFGSVTVYLHKQAGSSTSKSVTNPDWFEVDQTHFPGVYDLLLSASDTDTVGFLKYSVKVASSDYYIGVLEVVANIEADTYTVASKLQKYQEGRWKIDATSKQLTFYDTNGSTPLRTFDLKDATGTATSTSIYERVPV